MININLKKKLFLITLFLNFAANLSIFSMKREYSGLEGFGDIKKQKTTMLCDFDQLLPEIIAKIILETLTFNNIGQDRTQLTNLSLVCNFSF